MSRYGITVTVLATQLCDAVRADEDPEEGGFDLSAGLFGTNVSNWIRDTAKMLDDMRAERDRLAAELAECKRLIRKLGQYVPNDDPNRDIMRALAADGGAELREPF